jgi:hypothetical protein
MDRTDVIQEILNNNCNVDHRPGVVPVKFELAESHVLMCARDILAQITRTESGGDAYLCTKTMLCDAVSIRDHVILIPFSSEEEPIQIMFDIIKLPVTATPAPSASASNSSASALPTRQQQFKASFNGISNAFSLVTAFRTPDKYATKTNTSDSELLSPGNLSLMSRFLKRPSGSKGSDQLTQIDSWSEGIAFNNVETVDSLASTINNVSLIGDNNDSIIDYNSVSKSLSHKSNYDDCISTSSFSTATVSVRSSNSYSSTSTGSSSMAPLESLNSTSSGISLPNICIRVKVLFYKNKFLPTFDNYELIDIFFN